MSTKPSNFMILAFKVYSNQQPFAKVMYSRKIWWGIYFGGMPVFRGVCQYFMSQTFSVMSSFLHNHSFDVYNRPIARCFNQIIGMKFTIDSCSTRTSHLQRVLDTEVEGGGRESKRVATQTLVPLSVTYQ